VAVQLKVRVGDILEIRVLTSGDFLNPIIEFASDVRSVEKDLKEKDTQPRRRAYVRALFAMIEGSMYFLKQTCLSFSLRSGNPGHLSVGELAILDERTFDLSPNGTVTDQPKFLRIVANVRFLHIMLGRVFQRLCRKLPKTGKFGLASP
jgi:hypothetical protein